MAPSITPLAATPPVDESLTSPLRPKAITPLRNLPQRPTILAPTVTSPPVSPNSKQRDIEAGSNAPNNLDIMTPPLTPVRPRRSSSADERLDKISTPSAIKASGVNGITSSTIPALHEEPIRPDELPLPPSQPAEFTSSFTPIFGSSNRPQEYGRGVWSVVYKATLSPPIFASNSSPVAPLSRPGQLLAIKSPLHKSSEPVLHAEATILTYLSATSHSASHIVPFHGYYNSTSAIVLSAVPLSLTTYITSTESRARANFSTRTMFDPIIGTAAWLNLAHQLISALVWLHNCAFVIHGDVKPGNILLRPTASAGTAFPFQALLTDFSSSFHTSSAPASRSLALTTSFAAPELLVKSSCALPTKSTDVYSLGCTLLAAATGDVLIYPTQYEIQRLAMAREGKPLDFVRMGSEGTRTRKGGVVERIVGCAVGKHPDDRARTSTWLAKVEEVMDEMNNSP